MRWRWLSSFLIRVSDHAIWILVKVLPGASLIGLIRTRPWHWIRLNLPSQTVTLLVPRIRSLLIERSHQARIGSSCLSRALLGRILLDLVDIPNEMHLGMNTVTGIGKVPHAWLIADGKEFTPGIDSEDGCKILTL